MVGRTGFGWIASCSDDPDSDWGRVEGFCDAFEQLEEVKGRLILTATVWGTMNQPGMPPQPGDGFAWYHSTRAMFPAGDRFKRRPRLSAVGELLGAVVEGRHLAEIQVAIDPAQLKLMKEHPIVREDGTKAVFEACGIKAGPFAAFYRADKAAWRRLMALLPY